MEICLISKEMPFSESDVLPDGKVGYEGCRRAFHEKGTSRLKKNPGLSLILSHSPTLVSLHLWNEINIFWIQMFKRYVENYDIKLYAGFR